MKYRQSLSIILIATSRALADGPNVDIPPDTCADPDGFRACISPGLRTLNECAAEANGVDTQILACACEDLIDQLTCALSYCWNVVYGCDYQTLAYQLVTSCLYDSVPFFPAPDNAPGGCSCNLGYVSGNETAVTNIYNECLQNAYGDYEQSIACNCCFAAGEYTSIFSICPNTDPTLTSPPGSLDNLNLLWSQCQMSPNPYNCVQDLGFPRIAGLSYLTELPASTGTDGLYVTADSMASPLEVGTFTYTFSGGDQPVSTVTFTVDGASASSSVGVTSSPNYSYPTAYSYPTTSTSTSGSVRPTIGRNGLAIPGMFTCAFGAILVITLTMK